MGYIRYCPFKISDLWQGSRRKLFKSYLTRYRLNKGGICLIDIDVEYLSISFRYLQYSGNRLSTNWIQMYEEYMDNDHSRALVLE